MPLFQSVTLADRTIDLHKFTGEVVDEKIWSTTHVSGGGGGYNVGSGQQNPVSISSTSVTHNQFFLKNEAGEEKAFELADSSAPVRKGHRVTIFWANLHGQQNGSYVAIVNHSLNTRATFSDAIVGLITTPGSCWLPVAWTASILGICFYGIGLIGLIILFVYSGKQKKLKQERLATLQSAIDAAVTQAASS